MSDLPAVDARPLLVRLGPLIALVLVGVLAWQLASVLLLVFGAVVIAALLKALAEPVSRHTPLSQGLSLGLVVLAIIALVGGGGWLFGIQITTQVNGILERAPAAWSWIQLHLAANPAGRYILKNVAPSSFVSGAGVFNGVTTMATNTAGALTELLLVLVGGVYLAADPQLYFNGILLLTPGRVRASIGRALTESGDALRAWLFGQVIAMALIGTMTGVGMALIHTPSALVLGLFAGFAEFIPLIGPLIGALPALLTALSVSPHQVIWTAIIFVVIQQLESNAIQPIIQRRMVAVAPLVSLFSLAALGVLFGPIGLILSAPLTVIIVVWVKGLYVRDTLGEPIDPKEKGG
jgi:predicted PurR-regulated permease PerM